MKVLQVSCTDSLGSRFNGNDLFPAMAEQGIDSRHLVWEKRSDDQNSAELSPGKGREALRRWFARTEWNLSLQSILYPFSFSLPREKVFKEADVVHYQLIHTGFFSLASLPMLSKLKPTVWTLHDPWAMTGHCVHPYDCQKWLTGCGACPRLKEDFPLKYDTTALNFKLKKLFYEASDIDLVLCSKWMLSMARSSPLFSRFRLHHIPLGLDLDTFKPADASEARRKLGVKPGNVVLVLRATRSRYKGTPYVIEALRQLKTDKGITVITFNEKGMFEEFFGKHQIIDMGWVDDDQKLITAYNASDIMVMPSMAESFGMMAVEAMACAKPVIVFEGTALPETTFAPDCGVLVPLADSQALARAIDELADDSEKRSRLGLLGRKLAEEHYSQESHLKSIIELYQECIARRTGSARHSDTVRELALSERSKRS